MGACFNERAFDGKLTDAQLTKAYNDLVAELRYEHGTDAYNGTFSTLSGITVSDRVFESRQEASDFLANNTHKWENALAVKFKDIREQVVKSPTYGGNSDARSPVGLLEHLNDKPLRSITVAYTNGQHVATPADQLPAAEKTRAIALYSDWDAKHRAFLALRNSIFSICNQLQDLAAPAPSAEVFRELRKAIKQRIKALAVAQKAAKKLAAFDARHAPKLYATKKVDNGTQWLVGGWCAE